MEKPAREIIPAGSANETVPAHSPIPELLLAAINGEADPFHEGVVTAADIREYLLVQIHDLKLTPQEGKLNDPAFAEGSFLFRVINPEVSPPTESETIQLYREKAENGNATAQVQLGYLYEKGLERTPIKLYHVRRRRF